MPQSFSPAASVQPDLNSLLSLSGEPASALWCATELQNFSALIGPLAAAAAEQGRRIVYFHFTRQTLPVTDIPDLEICGIELSHRYEQFTTAVYNRILQSDGGELFLFDCLSELQTAWATDLMMVNFYLVIIPALKSRRCSAHFPLIRGRHSEEALDVLLRHADLYLNVFADFKYIWVRPEKIATGSGMHGPEADDYTRSLCQPQVYIPESQQFKPVRDGVLLSKFHRAVQMSERVIRHQHMDSWDHFFTHARIKYEFGEDLTDDCSRICRIMMTRDPRMRELVLRNFSAEDYFFIKEHMVGTGLIGGKACGMLTARKILENTRPDIYEHLEAHDSFFIGSDVYYTYLVENGLWDLRVRQGTPEEYFSAAPDLEKGIRHGVFPGNIRSQLLHLLDYFGLSPIIVRSSSILEDGFDNAFAGKYESVFCPNMGTQAERLRDLEEAIRIVYASTLGKSALDYRRRRGLDNRDEQMALLVMRVSGTMLGPYFMPCAAGVGYSCSPYRFLPDLDPSAGMLRLVCGLGTSAVDRTEGSYPRLVSLDRPEAVPYVTTAEQHRYSQRSVELIDTETLSLKKVSLKELEPYLPVYMQNLLLEHDFDAERMFRERGQRRSITFITCRGLVRNSSLMQDMSGMMQALQEEYEHPVDIEFTMNVSQDGEYVINLLQCRPLLVMQNNKSIRMPAVSDARPPLLECFHASMGLSRAVQLDAVVYIDPVAYYEMPYSEKPRIARLLGAVNWHFREKGKHLLLLTPGRIGTSSPELGVPTAFADISEFCAICEIAESRAGYQPELSYGSHIFQDLVEADILYTAVFEDEKTRHFHPEQLAGLPDSITEYGEDGKKYTGIVHIYDVSDAGCMLYHDMNEEHLMCWIPG